MSAENEDRERLTESDSNINTTTISELPGKSYGITMEVPLFLTMLSITLAGTTIANIVFYRTCIHSLGHSEEVCHVFLSPDNSNDTKTLEDEVQKYTTFINTIKMVLESVVPAILSCFLGVWSDTHGRKALVVWPLFGMAISSMMTVGYCLMDKLGPWWYIVTAIPYSLTGGYTVLFTGAFTYLSDITSSSSRSLRMTLLETAVSVGSVIGSVASSYLIRAIGNLYLLLLVAVLNVSAYAFTVVWIRESLTGAIQGGINTVLDILLVKEMVRECFKRRPNYGRAQILLVTIANSLTIFILYGIISLEYLYTREKLNWALKDYTIYSATNTTISFVGSLLGVVFIQKILPVSDLVFSIIAFLSSFTEYIIRTVAVKSWHMYLGAGVSLFKGLSAPLIRSFLTKTLPVEDIAKVFCLMCALEGICPLFAPVIFNSLYRYTIPKFPGAIYVLSSGITAVCVVLLGFVQYFRCRAPNITTYNSLN